MIRVAIVDDHEIFRGSVVRLLDDEADIEVVAQGASACDAVSIAANIAVDVMVLDWQLPDGNGVDAAATITSVVGAPMVILLTGYATISVQADAKRCGVSVILSKDQAAAGLARAIRSGETA